MSYEFYLDSYFLEHLMMNILVLHMTGHILKNVPSWKRILGAAALGAFLACMMILLPIHKNAVLYGICSFLTGPLIAAVCMKARRLKDVFNAVCAVCAAALCMGGIWQILTVQLGLPFWAAWLPGYLTVRAGARGFGRLRNRTGYLYRVILKRGDREVHLTALMDSGNRLLQPMTAKPVSIVEFQAVKELLSIQEAQELEELLNLRTVEQTTGKFLWIPYHSIGRSQGVLPAFRLDSICIKHGESARSTKGVLAAVSREAVSSGGEYQMILHPQILE
ncbi:MAG: sigma-E processing peptidase SpoIIGA [Eubacteriales bacterium]|nr:sigma-E processing peptidase SpoIIGA [Eubacteriales bacterium]